MVPVGNLAPGEKISFSYGLAKASSAGPGTFAATEQSGASGPLQELAASPVVTVSPAVAPSTPASSARRPHSRAGRSTPTSGARGR